MIPRGFLVLVLSLALACGSEQPVVTDLAGTSLETVELTVPAGIELCGVAGATASLDQASSAEVFLTLGAESSVGLEVADLAGLGLRGAMRRGPLSTDASEIRPEPGAIGAYEVRDPAGDTSLLAAVSYDAGGGYRLRLDVDVTRRRGDASPVELGGTEARLSLEVPGAAAPVALGPCPGEAEGEALELLVAVDGDRQAVVARHRALVEGEPGRVVAVELLAEMGSRLEGEWAIADAGDALRADARRDLVHYHALYRQLDRGEEPWGGREQRVIEEVEVEGGTLTYTVFHVAEDRRETRSLPVAVDWVRVDAGALGVELACDGAIVRGVRAVYTNHAVQLIGCPGDGPLGFELTHVVPVVFPQEPSETGSRISGEAISLTELEGAPAVAVEIGAHRLILARGTTAEDYRLQVRDATGATVVPPPVGFGEDYAYEVPIGELIASQFPDDVAFAVSEDGGVRMDLVRRYVGAGGGHSSIFAPVRFELSFDGASHVVELWDRLDYTSTHHNWDDELLAATDDLDIVLRVSEFYDYHVTATRRTDGRVVLPQTTLRTPRP